VNGVKLSHKHRRRRKFAPSGNRDSEAQISGIKSVCPGSVSRTPLIPVDTLRHWSANLEAMRRMPSKPQTLLGPVIELIAKDLVPFRPDERNHERRNAFPRTII